MTETVTPENTVPTATPATDSFIDAEIVPAVANSAPAGI